MWLKSARFGTIDENLSSWNKELSVFDCTFQRWGWRFQSVRKYRFGKLSGVCLIWLYVFLLFVFRTFSKNSSIHYTEAAKPDLAENCEFIDYLTIWKLTFNFINYFSNFYFVVLEVILLYKVYKNFALIIFFFSLKTPV